METFETSERQRRGRNVFELVADAVAADITHSAAGREVGDKVSRLVKKLEPVIGLDGVDEVENVIAAVLYVHANEMFKRGWELRGNPDLLGKLIQHP